MKRIYFGPGQCAFPDTLELLGIGVREPMPAGFVDRPDGMDSFLIVHFHSPAFINAGAGIEPVIPNQTVFWRPRRMQHFGHPTRRWVHSWLHLRGPAPRRILEAAGLPWEAPVAADGNRTIVPFLEMIHEELIAHSPPQPIILENLIEASAISGSRATGVLSESRPFPERFLAVRRHVDSNLHRRIGLAELARVAALSQSHFCSMFGRLFRMPPLRYVEEQRLRRAAFLLADRRLSVSEIANRTGFADPFYLSRRFRIFFGQSPRNFRLSGIDGDGQGKERGRTVGRDEL